MGVLIDGGASHNFIDVAWVKKRDIQTKSFDGFSVATAGHTMEWSERIPKLKGTLGKYTVIETFYVVDAPDMNVALGIQWMYSIGKYSTNYQNMEMEFKGEERQKVVLRGMNTYPPTSVTSQRMEEVLQQGDIQWVAECMVTFRKPPDEATQHLADIEGLLQKHKVVFGDLPAGRPPDSGFEHIIQLEEGTQAVITTPYTHPKRYKDEIESTIKELLKLGYIKPSSSPLHLQ